MRESFRATQRGFTLIELVMFIIIVGIAVSAVTLQFSQNVRHSADPLLRQQAIAIAHIYLDEITSKKWDENTPDGGGSVVPVPGASAVLGPDAGEPARINFDDVDDYDGLAETPIPGFPVTVAVAYSAWVDNPAAPIATVPAGESKQIIVSVSTPIGETLTFTQYRLDF